MFSLIADKETEMPITHEPYENMDNRALCLECGLPVDQDSYYCTACEAKLEAEGFFDVWGDYDTEDFDR